MGVFRSTGKILGVFINLRADKWFDLRGHIGNVKYISSQAKGLFTVDQADRSETFEDAIERLGITKEQLSVLDRNFTIYIFLFVTITVALLGYSLFLAINVKNVLATLMSLSLSVFSLVNAFRYHFWRFQIRSKKLGCSFRDWLDS